ILPNISNGWICERGLMQRILKAFPPGTIHLGWFINEPWGVRLTSKAAIPVLASDFFFNLEVWTSMQNVQGGEQGKVKVEDMAGASPVSPITTPTTIESQTGMPKAYVSFTFSDGDNLQYNQNRMSQLWQDAARGTIP